MERQLIIWGAGKLGDIAYHYYKDKYKDIIYVDVDSAKWNKSLNGIKICGPNDIVFSDCDVVIASRYNVESIVSELYSKEKIAKISIFDIKQQIVAKNDSVGENEGSFGDGFFSVYFSGGLGNQMFQYAFFKKLEAQGKKTYANISKCLISGNREFVLQKVFPEIKIQTITDAEEERVLKEIVTSYSFEKFMIYREKNERGTVKRAYKGLIDNDGGIFEGIFQTYYWAESLRDELLIDFDFEYHLDKELEKLVNAICADRSSVSVHFRRGDYLERRNKFLYGNICTDKYYDAAIKYIRERVATPHFYVFSDDIEFVKKKYSIPNCTYIDSGMFEKYADWYDMCLMSKCRYNIIANSTFSWWGAWLNTYSEKIVIAPEKWINIYRYSDIYPKHWHIIPSV